MGTVNMEFSTIPVKPLLLISYHSPVRRVTSRVLVIMKSYVVLIIFALISVVRGFEITNPFAKKDGITSQPKSAEIPIEIAQFIFEDYAELGSFLNDAPWKSFFRPFPQPASPKVIDTKIYLYTSKYPDQQFTVKLWKDISIEGSDFDPERPHTTFITHGFSSEGNAPWVHELKNAYLKQRDANVFIVDWGKGAGHWNYLQVASNTRVVGAELKRFVKYLLEVWNLDPARIHFMGHSLGAHISAYAAKEIPGVGQLTAFDPAQPGFEGNSAQVRLTKNDANFVDVIHTNIGPAPFLGFGLMLPTGHVDYYMNGGALQPGCVIPDFEELNITSIKDYSELPENPDHILPMVYAHAKLFSTWIACSHGKSYEYYTEALLSDYCTFWGRSTSYFGAILDVATFGRAILAWEKFDPCTLDTCSPIGLFAEQHPARGAFSVGTSETSPYCQNDPKITQLMKELTQQRLQQPNEDTNIGLKAGIMFLKNFFKPYF